MTRESFVGTALCLLPVLVIGLVLLLVWKFFRSAVRSGVTQAQPAAPQASLSPPPPPGPSDDHIRRIVREELKALLAARAAAKATPGSSGSTPPGGAGSPRKA